VIDVRERGPALGYIPGAIFIPFEILEETVDKLPGNKNSLLLTYCASGIISANAVTVLKSMGYSNVSSIRGGFNAWQVLGFEVASDGRLTPEQLNRYSRNILLEEIGTEGQAKLLNSKALIVGAVGLGSPAALYLAAAGVGTIGIADFDMLELSNLNRQVIHRAADVGRLKTHSARDGIERLNPDVKVLTYDERLTSRNIIDIVKEYDVVMDATDNIQTKFLLNDASYFAGKPYVFGGAVRFDGQAGVFYPKGGGPCLRCLFPKEPSQRQAPT
jgi:adenylyltransferase/sulfurtransferase